MKTGSQIRIGLVMVFAIAFSNASQACVPPAFERVAFEYGVPADIFYSIALAESGRSTNEFGFKVWPWALNINKRSFYPESKQAALVLIEQVISEGSDHFDVGLMQVSWRFHKATFKANANYALDVGANFAQVPKYSVSSSVKQMTFGKRWGSITLGLLRERLLLRQLSSTQIE